MSEMSPEQPAGLEATLEQQRAEIVAAAEALGLKVSDPHGLMPGRVGLRFDGEHKDMATVRELLTSRGIRLTDVSAVKEKRGGNGALQYAALNLAHPDNRGGALAALTGAARVVAPGPMPVDRRWARLLGNHAAAMLLHLGRLEQMAERAGIDTEDARPGTFAEFLHYVHGAVVALYEWALATGEASGWDRAQFVKDSYALEDRRCGVLMELATGEEEK